MLSSSLLFLRFLPCSFQVAARRLYSSLPTCHFLVLSRVSVTWKALGNSAVISCWTRIKLHVFIYFFFQDSLGSFAAAFSLPKEVIQPVAVPSVSLSRQPEFPSAPMGRPTIPRKPPSSSALLRRAGIASKCQQCLPRCQQRLSLPAQICRALGPSQLPVWSDCLPRVNYSKKRLIAKMLVWFECFFPCGNWSSLFVGKKIPVYRKRRVSLAGSLTYKWMSLYIQMYFMIEILIYILWLL